MARFDRRLRVWIALSVLLLVVPVVADAQYTQRYVATTNGAITFTGNTLGLNKAASSNGPGTNGAIGTFISTNLALTDSTPAPGWTAPTYAGTTAAWQQNGSSAVLAIPAGATVLYAELVWGGSYSYGGQNVSAFLNNAVSFVTPAATSSVTPAAATARQLGTAGTGGTCSSAPCYYVRSQNVTTLVQAGGSGTYAVAGVPATEATTENNANNAGWTLAVVYQDFSQPVRNLSVFTGLQQGGSAAASVSGFCTPPSGTLNGRLAVSALEGDPSITGDEMRFGPTATLGAGNRISGPNNPLTNFFASQINGNTGALNTTGSFGTRNSPVGGALAGARQGWDITNVDVSSQLTGNQTQAFAQGTTTGDQYAITTLGMQIDVAAPGFPSVVKSVDRATTRVGELLTYTVSINNTGTGTATGLVFRDAIPAGTSFVAGSVTVNGSAQPTASPVTGISLGDVASGTTRAVTFQVLVTAIPAAPAVAQYSNTASWDFTYVSCAGQPVQSGTFVTNAVVTTVPRVVPTKTASPSPVVPGTRLTYTVAMPNTGTANATGVSLAEVIPAGTTYVPSTTTLNGVPVPDGGGATMPYLGGALVHSPGEPAGQINVGEAAIVAFQVLVNPSTTGSVTNTATVDPDGAGGQATIPAVVTTPVAPTADIATSKSSTPNPYVPGLPLTYTIGVSNLGPSDAPGTRVQDVLPAALTGFTWTCAATGGATCSAGGSGNIDTLVGLPAGGRVTFVVTGTVPGGTTGALTNVVTATTPAGVTDPVPGNNSATDTNPAGPQADLAIAKSSAPNPYVPGQTLTYSLTVSNLGPSGVAGARVQDAFPAALSAFTWTCVGAAGGVCQAASGAGNIDTLVNLPPGAAATIVVSGVVPPGTTGSLDNTATVAVPAGVADPVPGNNSATALNPIGAVADLSLTKTASPDPYVAGSALTYTVAVSNAGPSTATNARVQDVLPGVLSAATWTCSGAGGGTCGTTSGAGSLDTLVTLAPGTSVVFTIASTVPSGTTGVISNTATVSGPVGVSDPNPANNSATHNSNPTFIADLGIAKSATPNPYVPGLPLTYTVTVANAGPSDAVNARVQDLLPAPLSAFTWTCTAAVGAVCGATSGTGSIDAVVTIPSGGSLTYTVTGLVPPATTGALANTATVAPPSGTNDPAAGNNTASVTSTAGPLADLTVSKASTPNPYVPGAPLTYTVVVSNLGPSDVVAATVTDTLPAALAGFTWTCTSAGGACATATGAGSFATAVDLPAGANATYVLTGLVPPGTLGQLDNTATVTPPGGVTDPAPGNNTTVDTNPAGPQADLSISKASTPSPYVPGAPLTYTVVVNNLGPSDVAGARVRDVLPAALAAFTWTCAPGGAGASCSASGSGSIDALVTLPAGTTATFTISGVVPAGTTAVLLNNATVTTPSGVTDPVPGNNTAADSSVAGPRADLTASKASSPNPYVPGAPLTYTMTVSNLGPSSVTGARIQDALPAPVSGFTWTCTASGGAVCGTPNGAGSIDMQADLPAASSVTIVASGIVPPATTGTLSNSITVRPPQGVVDPVPGNNDATSVSGASPVSDLSVSKTSTPNPYVPGLPLTYTVVVGNAGPSNIQGARVQDVLPSALSAFTWSCTATSGGVCVTAGGTGSVDALVDLAVGATATFTVTGLVPAGTTGALVNTATATVPFGVVDPTPGNDAATDTNPTNAVADLTVTKSSAPNPYVAGLPLTYTVAVNNLGPSDALGARVQDALPAPLSAFTWTCGGTGGGTCVTASGAGNIDAVLNLPAGAGVVFTVTGTVPPGTSGGLVNTATVTAPPGVGDPVPGSNTATDSNPAGPQANLSITKVSTPNPYVPGAGLTYAVVVSNAGPSNVVAARVQDVLPSPLGTFTWTCSGAGGGTCLTPAGSGSIDAFVTLAAGTSVTFSVTGTVPPGTSGGLVNTATVTPPPGVIDPVAGDNSATDSNPAGPQANLVLTKSGAPDPYVPGLPLTYTIAVTNLGPSTALNSRVQDTLPPALSAFTWTCATAGGGVCGAASGAGNIDTVVDLPVSGSVIFTVTGVVPANVTGTLVNTATATPPAGTTDPVPTDNSASAASGPAPQADLTASKSSTPNPYVPGLPLSYTLTIHNLGPSDVTGATVVDAVPPALTGVTWTCAGSAGATCPASGSGNLNTPVNLPAGASAVFVVTATVPPGTTGVLLNAVTVTPPGGTTDPVPGNNTGTDVSPAGPQADLAVSKSSTPSPYVPGAPLTYTVTVSNAGPSDVTGARVRDALPAPLSGFTWTCAASVGAACATPSGSGSIDALVTLPSGASATFTLTGVVPAGLTGALVNTATITAPAGVTDPVPGNNTASNANNANAQADLSISKSSTPDPYVPGLPLTYTITVANAGPSDALDARVQDALPAPLSAFTWTCLPNGTAACGIAGGTGSLDAVIDVPAGSSVTFIVTGTVPSGTTGPLVNTATVAAPAGVVDPVPGNNGATDTNPSNQIANLAVTKSSGPDPYVPGLALTYTILVANSGPSDVVNARVQDALPAGLAAFTWTCAGSAGATCGVPSGTGNIDVLVSVPAGTSVSFVATGLVPPGTTGPLANTASVAPPAGITDPVPGDNQSTNINPANLQADLSVAKTSTPNPYVPGLPLTYTVVVANAGPSNAVNARVQDTLPAPFSAFSWTCVSAGGACAASSGVGDIDALVTLPVGATATFAVTGVVPSGTVGQLANTATVTAPPGVADPVPGNNTAVDTNPTNLVANLSVSKASTPNPYVPGQPLTYTVVVSNAGPSDVSNARVQDTLPAALAAFTWTCAPSGGGTCATTPGTGNIDALVTLPAGTAVSFTVTGTVPSATTGPLVNAASVTPPAGVTDPVPGDNTTGNTNPTGAIADLSITKASAPNPYVPGLALTYTIVVRNSGPSDVVGARVQDALPGPLAAFTWTCTSAGGTCATPSGVGSLDTTVSLPAGSTATFVVTGVVPPGTSGSLANVATVSPPAGTTDPVPGNNGGGTANPATTIVDLSVVKTSAPNPYIAGGPLTYTIVVSNTGPSSAVNARVQDALPAPLGAFTWTCTTGGGGICGTLAGTGDIDALVTLPPATSVTFVVTGTVPVGTVGPLTNVATVTPAVGVIDANPGNNGGTDVNQPLGTGAPTGAELCLLQVFPATALPGALVTFTYTTINRGPGVATNLLIDGMLPVGVTYVSASPSAGGAVSIVNGMFIATWTGGTLPGQSRSVSVTYRVNTGLPQGTIVSGWFMTSANEVDPYLPNNMVDSYTFVGGNGPSADLVLRGEARASGVAGLNAPVRIGQPGEWLLAVTNNGAVPATGTYALILDGGASLRVTAARSSQGVLGVSGPQSGVWSTDLIPPGATATLAITVTPQDATAVKLLAMRVDGVPSDPDATNDWIELSLDAVGTAPLSGRTVAVGNVDGGPTGEIVVGTGRGETPQIHIFDAGGARVGGPYFVFDRTFTGGLRLASCDVDADGVAEIVAGQASGGGLVRVFRWQGGVFTDVVTFTPFEASFAGGVDVACADLDGNGRAEVVVGAGAGRAPDVRVFSIAPGSAIQTHTFTAYESAFAGGVRVSAARHAGGVVPGFEIVTTPGAGRPVDLALWRLSGATASASASVTLASGGGAFTALGDANNDGQLDLAVMLDGGTPTLLSLFSLGNAQLFGQLPGGALGFTGGMQLAIGAVAAGAGREIVTVDGPGAVPRVQVFRLAPSGAGLQRLGFLALEAP